MEYIFQYPSPSEMCSRRSAIRRCAVELTGRNCAVLPKATLVLPVGGIRPDNMAPYWAVGANGFGTGSNLYQPGTSATAVRKVAAEYASAFAKLEAR